MRVVLSRLHWLLVPLLVVVLAGCKVEFYSELSEEEANEMVSLLVANGIDASKGAVTKGMVSVDVSEADLSAAVQILRQNGFPRDQFHDLGTIFRQQGLISSPLEEHVRYVYGLSQTLAETLTQIDGVITARVHVVIPEQSAIGATSETATASVFLKTRPGASISDHIQQIKMLVQNSVAGLSYEKVSVVVFEADSTRTERAAGPPMTEFLGVRYTTDSADTIVAIAAVLAAILIVAVGTSIIVLIRRRPAPALPARKNG